MARMRRYDGTIMAGQSLEAHLTEVNLRGIAEKTSRSTGSLVDMQAPHGRGISAIRKEEKALKIRDIETASSRDSKDSSQAWENPDHADDGSAFVQNIEISYIEYSSGHELECRLLTPRGVSYEPDHRPFQ